MCASSQSVCVADAFPDGRKAISDLRAGGIRIGLVSNCTSDVRQALGDHGMDHWFDEMILSAEVGVMKPAEEIHTLAARALGVEPASCLYVADGHQRRVARRRPGRHDTSPLRPGLDLDDRASTSSRQGVTTIRSHLELLQIATGPEAGIPIDDVDGGD